MLFLANNTGLSRKQVIMPASIPPMTLEKFTTFGDLLRFLRRRAGLTQLELSFQVGYSDTQISRLEQNLRLPDLPTIEDRFVTALRINNEPEVIARLLDLAAKVKREDAPVFGLCPYKGLSYFDEADADLFVGREALTAKLAERVISLSAEDYAGNERFLAVVGASGSGKSSLVRAGLVPALRWDKRSANWPIYVLTPTAHPLESLAVSLNQESESVNATLALMDDLKRDQRSLSVFINRMFKTTSAPSILLFIDQFEELFALCRSEEERLAFIDSLLFSSAKEDGRAIVVISLRADFYASCAGYPQLRQALARSQEYIGAMSDEELRRVIEEPARRGRWEVEPGLTDLILHDVGHEPGALPLLSHALYETWQRRHGRTMTFSGYSSSGGVRGAIAETAEAVFVDQFTHEQQAIARRIFLRLTELGSETAASDTRREVKFSELILNPEDAGATQAVLKALADARLITTSQDSAQVAHEALIREWPTLRGWLEENRDGLRLHRHLTDASQEWIASKREPDLLYRGVRLAQVQEWAVSHRDDMNIQEVEFLEASVALSEKEAAEREAQNQREMEAARQLANSEHLRAESEKHRAEDESRAAKRLRQRAIYLSIALIAAFALVLISIFFGQQASQNAMLAGQNQNIAQAASTHAIAQQETAQNASTQAMNEANTRATAEANAISESNIRATAQVQANAESAINHSLALAQAALQANQAGQGDLAIALALEAVKGDQPPVEAVQALRQVALSPGIRLMLNGHHMEVRAVAISPDDQSAFSGSCAQAGDKGKCESGDLILWSLETGEELKHWAAHSGWVNTVAFSRDGGELISGGEDGSLIVWDTDTGNEIRQLVGHTGSITSLAVDMNSGALLSGSSDGSLILWDLQTGAILRRFTGHDSPVTTVSVSTEKPLIVSGYADGMVILWDLDSAGIIMNIEGNGFPVEAVVINRDGSWILSTSGFDLRMIDALTGAVKRTQSWGGMPELLALSPDENTVYINRRILIQFDLKNWREQQVFLGSSESVTALTISQDKPLGLVGYADGSLRLWDLVEQLDYQSFDIGMQPDSMAASPDGKYLLLGNMFLGDPNLILWDIAESRVVRSYQGFDGLTAPGAIAISPDGQFVAAGGGYLNMPVYNLMVWKYVSGEVQCSFDVKNAIPRSIAISPDSRWLLSGTQGNSDIGEINALVLWDIQTCQFVRQFNMNEIEDVTGIAFSSDGKRAITGSAFSNPNRVILWDINTGEEIRRFELAGTGFRPIFDVEFGPGDHTVLGADADSLCLWDLETGDIIRRYTGLSSVIWSYDISSDGKYILAGADNNEVILWDFNTGQELYSHTAHKQTVYSVTFSPNSKTAFSISNDGMLVQWNISDKSLQEWIDWIYANRYVRNLTCDEKIQFRIESTCQP
jgi:WD40 repeat protein/transcriptional regulator with XRE-family HTH domain